MTDLRPANCRFRLHDEGKPYPRSGCRGCGKTIMSGLGNKCGMPDESELVERVAVYAETLAVALHKKHYPEMVNWEPLSGDLMGLLTQIDNVTVGLSRRTAIRPGDRLPGGLVAVPVEDVFDPLQGKAELDTDRSNFGVPIIGAAKTMLDAAKGSEMGYYDTHGYLARDFSGMAFTCTKSKPPGPKDIGNLKWCKSVSPAYKNLCEWSDFKRWLAQQPEKR